MKPGPGFFLLAVATLAAAFEAVRRAIIQRGIDSVAEKVLLLQKIAGEEMRYRPLEPKDADLMRYPDLLNAAQREYESFGLISLGDRVEERENGSSNGITRWFMDRQGTTCGWCGAIPGPFKQAASPVMTLFSETEGGDFFITSRGGTAAGLAAPPSQHRHFIPWSEGLAAAIDRHASFIAPNPTLRRAGNIEDAIGLVQRLRKARTEWRASRPPDELLVLDVHSLTQKHFDWSGEMILETVRSKTSPEP